MPEDVEAARVPLVHAQMDAKHMASLSKLRSVSVAINLCLIVFVGLLTARLESLEIIQWPFYFDYIPLWLLPILIYLSATDFAQTRISYQAALGKVVIVSCGFLLSLSLCLLTALVSMKLSSVVDWSWTFILSPLWLSVLAAQMFTCFLIPGYLRLDKIVDIVITFCSIWMVAGTLLLISFKLDGEMPHWLWSYTFIPAWIAILAQMIVWCGPMELLTRLLLLVVTMMLALQLDEVIHVPWTVITGPILLILLVNAMLVGCGPDEFEKGP